MGEEDLKRVGKKGETIKRVINWEGLSMVLEKKNGF